MDETLKLKHPLPLGALNLLAYIAKCEKVGEKPNLDRKGRALNTLRSLGHIHAKPPKTTARGRRLLAWIGGATK